MLHLDTFKLEVWTGSGFCVVADGRPSIVNHTYMPFWVVWLATFPGKHHGQLERGTMESVGWRQVMRM